MIPIPLTSSNWKSTLLLNFIHRSWILMICYKAFKFILRFVLGTSELGRIVNNALSKEVPSTQSRSLALCIDREQLESDVVRKIQNGMASVERLPPIDRSHFLYRLDRCILFSSKLLKERRKLESNFEKDYDAAIESIVFKKRIKGVSDLKLVYGGLIFYASTFKLMNNLNSRASTKFDPTASQDEKKLVELWGLMMTDEDLLDRVSPQWKKIGFQGNDPVTDFRGMGMLGLDNLVYFAKNHGDEAAKCLIISNNPTSWFSYAIVGINITSFCLHLGRTRSLQLYFYQNGPTVNAFHEFYCHIMISFCNYWKQHPKSVTILDFPEVFKEFSILVNKALISNDLQSLLPKTKSKKN